MMEIPEGKVSLLDAVPVRCGHGTAVWNLIDGHRTVREIISLLARHFGEEENYIPRVTAYVMQLRKDGFIQLTIRN